MMYSILNFEVPPPAAAKREDGLWVEPAGALELQQSEGVYSDCGAGLIETLISIPPKNPHQNIKQFALF